MQSRSKGFTLIEVLIAGSIMFMVLVMVTDSFLTARNSSRHAANVIAMLEPVPLLQEHIKLQLSAALTEQMQGEGLHGQIRYRWQATLTERAAPVPRFEVETGTHTVFDERFYLYQVELTVSSAGQQKAFSYAELVWKLPTGGR